ncbi:H/ACA RNA-protein complex protein Gar1 [Candidatus Bathyarchaeota archaeon]|nr:H/ACA RNA-protein complex protein Gar1 [Candidatus Bathyarchaeota archaeon]MBS7636934.1 H/ACA RNA-protein complex protein Gar1 [Candidatus Bathyarchaeota archaeon]
MSRLNLFVFRGEFKRLIRLGRALHISPSRNVIVKVENVPKIGETVVDENLRRVGEVFDVFGPVSSPYVAVKPKGVKPEVLVNKVLYILPSKKGKERK